MRWDYDTNAEKYYPADFNTEDDTDGNEATSITTLKYGENWIDCYNGRNSILKITKDVKTDTIPAAEAANARFRPPKPQTRNLSLL